MANTKRNAAAVALGRLGGLKGCRIVEFLGGEGARFDGKAGAFVTVSQEGEEEVWPAE